MKIQLEIIADHNQEKICYVTKDILKSLGASNNKRYNLHLGSLNSQVTIKLRNEDKKSDYRKKGKIYLSSNIFGSDFTSNEFSNLQGTKLNIWKKGNNIYLGPVVGIFVKPRRFNFYNNGTTDPIHLIAGSNKSVLCYLFSLEGIDWINKKVTGITYIPKLGKWSKISLPLPNVVYDRGSDFTEFQKDIVKNIREKLYNDFKVYFINNRDAIGKWKIYKYLLNYDEVANNLPQTARYRSVNDILVMLKRFNFVFLKATYGKRGKQVMSIQKLENKYKINYYSKGLQELEVNSKEELKEQVDSFIKDGNYIIQQGITLLKFQNRRFDLRVFLNKDISGQWKVMKNYIRIALKEEQTLTNYSVGSERINYSEFFPELYREQNGNIPTPHDVETLAVKTAYCIDKEFGDFGELGLDFAIDSTGKLWLLEVNTKPAKGFGLEVLPYSP